LFDTLLLVGESLLFWIVLASHHTIYYYLFNGLGVRANPQETLWKAGADLEQVVAKMKTSPVFLKYFDMSVLPYTRQGPYGPQIGITVTCPSNEYESGSDDGFDPSDLENDPHSLSNLTDLENDPRSLSNPFLWAICKAFDRQDAAAKSKAIIKKAQINLFKGFSLNRDLYDVVIPKFDHQRDDSGRNLVLPLNFKQDKQMNMAQEAIAVLFEMGM